MRALVLSGGGVKGAYQIGALKHLINERGLKYDIVCGISVGALNVSFLSMFKDDQEGFAGLLKFWESLDSSKIYKRWFPFGKLHALWKKSLYNSQPLIDLMHSSIDINKVRTSGKKVAVGAVSLDTGDYRLFTEKDDCFIDGVLASSSFPSGLKPIEIDKQLWTDGGVKHITPLKAAIDLGADEVDMIICSPIKTTNKYDKNSKTIGLAQRTIDLMTDQIIEADIQIANMYNKLVLSGVCSNKRFVKINSIRPDFDLIDDSLRFNNAEINRMIDIGYQDAIVKYK
jgi:NTE family protein